MTMVSLNAGSESILKKGRKDWRLNARPQQQRPIKGSCPKRQKKICWRESAAACGDRLPKKFASLGFGRRATPAQKTQVVQTLRPKYPLLLLLEIAQLPPATFYYHVKKMHRADKYADAKTEIAAIYHENKGRYGYGVSLWYFTAEDFSEPQDCPAADERTGLGLPCQNQEISLLQRRNWQDCAKFAEQRTSMPKSQTRIGSPM